MTASNEPGRVGIMREGIEITLGARAETYGDFFTNMKNLAVLWDAYLTARGYKALDAPALDAQDAAWMMVDVKKARALDHERLPHRDNYVDASVFAAAAGEFAVLSSGR